MRTGEQIQSAERQSLFLYPADKNLRVVLSSKELDLIGDSNTDHNLLGFAILLKYFQQEGRFPSQKQDIPSILIVHLAQQLSVVPEKIIPYDWDGRTIKAHLAAIRAFLNVHEATLSDEEAMIEALCENVLAEQRQKDALIASMYASCKKGSEEDISLKSFLEHFQFLFHLRREGNSTLGIFLE
ncbi:MAG: DUF4158 domain-containing protein [Ktedonobacteraceae bacterium]|nr:DUF4158 domain-containing protein [Ktedonobacteraceae bacterium]